MFSLALAERGCFCKGFRESRKPLDPGLQKKKKKKTQAKWTWSKILYQGLEG